MTKPKPGAVRGRPRVPHRPHVAARLSQADYDRLQAYATKETPAASIIETAIVRYLATLDRRKSKS